MASRGPAVDQAGGCAAGSRRRGNPAGQALEHPNVARLDGQFVYFDWTDACIAHPFIDLLCLSWEKDEETRAALRDAYLEPWRGVETAERLREAAALAEVVIPLHHAVSYQHIGAGLEPAAKPELDATPALLRRVLGAELLLRSAKSSY